MANMSDEKKFIILRIMQAGILHLLRTPGDIPLMVAEGRV